MGKNIATNMIIQIEAPMIGKLLRKKEFRKGEINLVQIYEKY